MNAKKPIQILGKVLRDGGTELELRDQQLTILPTEIIQLTQLAKLDLSENLLTNLPPEIGELICLKSLDLSYNKLTSLPVEIGQLTGLKVLNISNNKLDSLPPEIGRLKKLEELYWDGNPLKLMPPEILKQGTKAVLAYLQAQLRTRGIQQWVSKLLVVGEGGVGKTQLLRRLRGEDFDSQELTTHGIEIKALTLEHPSEQQDGKPINMRLNTWDFGGQEIYHATHQFFLTNRSLFLLVWNARTGFKQSKLYYWLKTIRANAPESPILLVATHLDERDADLPLNEIRQQFPQIIDQLEVSNKSGVGILRLRKTIANIAAQLPLMGESWPTTWLNFANSIRTSSDKHVTSQKFFDGMTQYQVTSESQRVLAQWLHELGEILFFQYNDELKDTIILKPQWVTQYISKVLEGEEVIARKGIFTRTCMDQLWHDLDPSMRNHFLCLMERFDLSYRTLENRDISLIVERLPFEAPDYETFWREIKRKFNCKEISMKFQLSELLPGIPTWFIARQHRFTLNLHWRTGVLLADEREDAKHLGLIQVGRDEKTNVEYLQLTVRGAMPHSFFDILREGLELTLRRYPGLQITRLIPCPDPSRQNCIHEFDYSHLTRRLERQPPKPDIECPNCLENISVNQLLFGLHYTTENNVLKEMDRLKKSLDDLKVNLDQRMEEGYEELRKLVQIGFARQFRRDQEYLESHCPNVFVLRPDNRKIWNRNLESQRIYVQLYCQQPGCWHPTKEGGLYPIDEPREWLKVTAPYLRGLVKILKYTTPILGPWVNIAANDYEELINSDLKLMDDLITRLDDDIEALLPSESTKSFSSKNSPQKISGAALRSLRKLLEQEDQEQYWGGLKKVLTPEGDYLWLCDYHARAYKSLV